MKKNIHVQLLVFLSLALTFTAVFAAFAHSGSLRDAAPRGALTARGETAATETAATPTAATPSEATHSGATPSAATQTETRPDEPAPAAIPSAAAKTENGFTYVVSNGQAAVIAVDDSVAGDVTVPAVLGGAPVTVIGMGAFKENGRITSVTLPDTVAQIDEQAFKGCPSLEKLSFGQGLTALPESAVADCEKLTSLVFSKENANYATDENGAVYNAARTELVTVSREITGEFTVPATVAIVRGGAFRGCGSLTKVTFAGANTVLGEGAFRDCAALVSAVLPENLKTVPADAFAGCAVLTDAALPSSVEVIGDRAFAGCGQLNVSLPGGLKALGEAAFSGCNALTAAVLPDGCTSIGSGAFENCGTLANVSLPTGLTALPDDIFLNCVALKNVENAAAVDTVGARAFYGCAALEEAGNYTNFVRVGLDAFTGTKWFNDFAGGALNGKNLLLLYKPAVSEKTMTVGENITAIAPGALRGCAGLEEITLPAGLLSIGEAAFANCTGLKEIVIPAGVKEIGANAFSGCISLVSASFEGTAKIGADAFTGTAFAALARSEETDLLLGANLLRAAAAYPQAAATATEADAVAPRNAATATDPVSTTGAVTVTDAATATDGGKASETDAGRATETDGKQPPVPGDGEANVYTVRTGVRSIASGAFLGAENLDRIVLPEGLTILSDNAFAGLSGHTDVNRPSTLVYGDDALNALKESGAACAHTATVLRYEDLKRCAAPWFTGCTYCAECAALLDRGALQAPTGHQFVKTAETADAVTLTCSVCREVKIISAAEYNVALTDGDRARAEGEFVIVAEGLTAAELLGQCPAGTVIRNAANLPVEGAAPVGSGMTVLFPSTRAYTVVLYGDADGDGVISPADARIALRRSVKLDEALSWRDKACHVIADGSAVVSSEDARLILRASVGLENAADFGKLTPPQPGEPSGPEDPGTDPGPENPGPENPGTDPGPDNPSQPGKEEPTPSEEYKTGAYYCTAETGVYLRTQPNTGASQMDIIQYNGIITVKEVFKDGNGVWWGKITNRGVTGWLQLEYFEAV